MIIEGLQPHNPAIEGLQPPNPRSDKSLVLKESSFLFPRKKFQDYQTNCFVISRNNFLENDFQIYRI